MDRCRLAAISSVVAMVVLAPLTLAGQEAGWVAPRTPWGDPDLMGTYTNKTFTPLQRPPELAGQRAIERQGRASSR